MRLLQVSLFIVGALSFVTAAAFVGDDTGDVLWRTGVAAMLTDIAGVTLWPSRAEGRNE
jgi:hypothetical protein